MGSSRERDPEHDGRSRHRRSYSSRSRRASSSSSSSATSETDEPTQDSRMILSFARARLTSPSTISNLTCLTSTTNKSSSSSGSNSTVTQASVTRRSSSTKKPDATVAPLSPAVPDAPNVFAYLDTAESVADQDEGPEVEEYSKPASWMPNHLQRCYAESALPVHMLQDHPSSSSSTNSSHNGDDNLSERHHDVDTDRTTPEGSVEGSVGDQGEVQRQDDDEKAESDPEAETSHADDTSAKIASQMAAAQHRQSIHGHVHQFGTSDMRPGQANRPHISSTALMSPHPQQQAKQRPLPNAERSTVSGYELLASQLSSRAVASDIENGEKIKAHIQKVRGLESSCFAPLTG